MHFDVLHLLDFAVDAATLLMLDDLIAQAPTAALSPELPLDAKYEAGHLAALEWARVVQRKIGGTDRENEWFSILHQAEYDAEKMLENTPQDQRALGIDPIILRRYGISYLQCARTLSFLNSQRNEVHERMLSKRSDLINRYSKRNKA
jgi:hypothetical protein